MKFEHMDQLSCIVCGSRKSKELYILPDLMLDRENIHAQFMRCEYCGLIYQIQHPSKDVMFNNYPENYDPYTIGSGRGKSSWLPQGLRDRMRMISQHGIRMRCAWVNKYKSSGTLLDIGCSTGEFLVEMQKNPDWQVSGVENNAFAAKLAQENYGLQVYRGTLHQAHLPDQFFDVVTLWDVLEHLPDPVESLAEISRILKKDGLLILRVPNASSRDAKLFGRFWSGYDAPRHLYAFDPQTLRQLLSKHHFQIKAIDTQFGRYASFVISVRFWLTANVKNNIIKRAIAWIIDNPITQLITAPVFYLRSRGLMGPEITLVASPSQT